LSSKSTRRKLLNGQCINQIKGTWGFFFKLSTPVSRIRTLQLKQAYHVLLSLSLSKVLKNMFSSPLSSNYLVARLWDIHGSCSLCVSSNLTNFSLKKKMMMMAKKGRKKHMGHFSPPVGLVLSLSLKLWLNERGCGWSLFHARHHTHYPLIWCKMFWQDIVMGAALSRWIIMCIAWSKYFVYQNGSHPHSPTWASYIFVFYHIVLPFYFFG
jgi:hypothetical protein